MIQSAIQGHHDRDRLKNFMSKLIGNEAGSFDARAARHGGDSFMRFGCFLIFGNEEEQIVEFHVDDSIRDEDVADFSQLLPHLMLLRIRRSSLSVFEPDKCPRSLRELEFHSNHITEWKLDSIPNTLKMLEIWGDGPLISPIPRREIGTRPLPNGLVLDLGPYWKLGPVEVNLGGVMEKLDEDHGDMEFTPDFVIRHDLLRYVGYDNGNAVEIVRELWGRTPTRNVVFPEHRELGRDYRYWRHRTNQMMKCIPNTRHIIGTLCEPFRRPRRFLDPLGRRGLNQDGDSEYLRISGWPLRMSDIYDWSALPPTLRTLDLRECRFTEIDLSRQTTLPASELVVDLRGNPLQRLIGARARTEVIVDDLKMVEGLCGDEGDVEHVDGVRNCEGRCFDRPLIKNC